MRYGLVCQFVREPIRFRTTTAKVLQASPRKEQLEKLSRLCLENVQSVLMALEFCKAQGIGSFRLTSHLLPLRTHPDCGYTLDDLPRKKAILLAFEANREYARANDLRLTFHPDQFIVLSSPIQNTTDNSIRELIHTAEVAELIGADVINIHAGGVYGDPETALKRLESRIRSLPEAVRQRITLENDDRSYTPSQLLPLCKRIGVPFVYDVHHHRCLPDKLTREKAVEAALNTWNREPLFHVSSPSVPWEENGEHRFHDDYIRIEDFPEEWPGMDITVEIEAKAKELAVLKLKADVENLTK
jgi:UV DNA damage endonuclease